MSRTLNKKDSRQVSVTRPIGAASRQAVDIVVVYNEPETLETVFLKSAGLSRARVTLVDNTVAGRGLPGIFNEHKAASPADWIVFCHQDFIVFEQDWLERLVRLSADACYGPVGIASTGQLVGRITQTDGTLLGAPLDGTDAVGLDEQCLIVPRTIFSTIDFDPQFPFDLYVHDYCLSARNAGFGTKIFQLDCQHRSKTITGNVTGRAYLKAKEAYIRKHRHVAPLLTTTFVWRPKYWVTPEELETGRAELALIPERSRVLEVGTASGAMSQALKRKGCVVTGIEIDPEMASAARRICARMVVGNVEELDLDAELLESFDVVLCGDVLEHLRDPRAVVQKLARCLSADGYFVVSLPNVAHGSVRLSLLGGDFRYRSEGLLDATHLRFFTLESLVDFFNALGLKILDLHRTRMGFFETEIAVDLSCLTVAAAPRLLEDPEATVYQYVFRAVPSKESNTLSALRDPAFDARREQEAFGQYCLAQAFEAFNKGPAAGLTARRWATLALATRPGPKAAIYWILSYMPQVKSFLAYVARKVLTR